MTDNNSPSGRPEQSAGAAKLQADFGADGNKLEQKTFLGFIPVEDELTSALNIGEVVALIRYASERGINPNGLLEELFEDIARFRDERLIGQAKRILANYTKLCELTQPVTGRNVYGAENLLFETKWFTISTFLIFLISIGFLAVGLWMRDEPLSDGYFGMPSTVLNHYLPFLTPFFWGALGSCVFILKKINDEASTLTFDPDQFKGWVTRALLGAVLGGSIIHVIDQEAFGAVAITSTAIAFLAGLGTKAVYGGLEKVIELLVEKMNLQTLKRRKTTADAVAEFLAGEIARTDPKKQEHKYKTLVDLMQARS